MDAATLKEAEKNKEAARIKRENHETNAAVHVKKELNIVDLITLDNDEARALNTTEINETAMRLLKPAGAKAKRSPAAKKPAAPKVKAEKGVKAEKSTPEKEKAAKGKAKPKSDNKTLDGFLTKKAGKKADSSDEEDEVCLSGESEFEEEIVSEKRSLPARKKQVASYAYGSGVESEASGAESGSESAGEESSKKSRKKKHDDTSDDEVEMINTSEEKPKPKKVRVRLLLKLDSNRS